MPYEHFLNSFMPVRTITATGIFHISMTRVKLQGPPPPIASFVPKATLAQDTLMDLPCLNICKKVMLTDRIHENPHTFVATKQRNTFRLLAHRCQSVVGG